MARWITGKDLLERWEALPYELLDIMRAGTLLPKDILRGRYQTADSNPCLYCNMEPERKGFHSVPCPHGTSVAQTLGSLCSQELTCTDWEPSQKIKRLHEANFILSEVEAYEQAHGLGPLPHKPEDTKALKETLRKAGITEECMLARMLKAAFPATTLRALGSILSDNPDDDSRESANKKAAQRALKPK